MPFNALLQVILEKGSSKGVFIGEIHTKPAINDSLRHLMPMLHAQGITTVSLEITPSIVKNILESQNIEVWKKTLDAKQIQGSEKLYMLVKQADKHGIKVIGHESEDHYDEFSKQSIGLIKKAFPNEVEKMEKEVKAEKVPEAKGKLEAQYAKNLLAKLMSDP